MSNPQERSPWPRGGAPISYIEELVSRQQGWCHCAVPAIITENHHTSEAYPGAGAGCPAV